MVKLNNLSDKIGEEIQESARLIAELEKSIRKNGVLSYDEVTSMRKIAIALTDLRDAHLLLMIQKGMSAKDAAAMHGLSQARVSQICTREKNK